MNFLHNGKCGDIVWSLPCLKPGPSNLYIRAQDKPYMDDAINRETALQMVKLLDGQECLNEVALYDHQPIDVDLNEFRKYAIQMPHMHLVSCHEYATARHTDGYQPWLKYPPKEVAPIVINRSERNLGWLEWRLLLPHRKKCIFIGLKKEWLMFNDLLDVEYYDCQDLYELACVVAGSRLFIGNQSLFNSIAVAMHHPLCLEVNPQAPNSMPFKNGHTRLTNELLETIV